MTGGMSAGVRARRAGGAWRRHLASLLSLAVGLAVGMTLLAAVPAQAAWTPPRPLGTMAGGAVVIDSTMTTHRAWTVATPAGRDIMAAHRPPGGTWSAPVRVRSGPASTDNLRLLPGASGSVTLLWVEAVDDFTDGLWSSQRAASGSWDAPVELSTGVDEWVYPSAAANARGDMVVVWGASDIALGRTARAGGTWSPVRILATRVGTSPQAGIDDAGNVTVAWRSAAPAPGAVALCRTTLAASDPCGATTYAGPPGNSLNVRLAVGPAGHRSLVFDLEAADGTFGFHATRETAGAWSPATPLATSTFGVPAVAVDGAGAATVVAPTDDELVVLRSSGDGWNRVHAVPGPFAMPSIVLDRVTGLVAIGANRLGSPLPSAVVRELPGGWAPADLAGTPTNNLSGVHLHAHGGYVEAVHAGLLGGETSQAQARTWDDRAPQVTSVTTPIVRVATTVTYEAYATDWLPTTTTWDWGDGTTSTGARVTHAYGTIGTYVVTAVTSDLAGNATTHTSTVQVTATGTAQEPDVGGSTSPTSTSPSITGLRLTRGTISRGARTPRRTHAVVTTTARGTLRLAFRKRGTRKPVATLTRTITATSARVAITAKVGRKRLKPGRYTITAVLTSASGTSKPVAVRLRVVR